MSASTITFTPESAMSRTRTAIVTGAAGGIGVGIAKDLARLGYDVGISDVDDARLAEAADRIRPSTGPSHIYSRAVDLRDRAATADAIDQLAADLGGVDVLVNCAGLLKDARVSAMSPDWFRHVLEINLGGMLSTTTAALPYLRESGSGRIISLTSRAWLGNFGSTNYAASKGAIAGVSRSLSLALADDNVTVNCVAPGFIETPMSQSMPDHILDRVRQSIPVTRVGVPYDVARAVSFLAAEEAGYITGQTLTVCGGRSIAGSLRNA